MLILLLACRVPTPAGFDSKNLFNDDTSVLDTSAVQDTGIEAVDGESPFGCEPKAETQTVTEGEVVQLQFLCTGGATANTWEIVSAPAGAAIDAESGLVYWQTDLASGGEWEVVVRAVGAGNETGSGKVWVVDAWDHPENEPVNPLTYTEELGLPVLHIAVPANINRNTKVPTTVVFRGESFDIDIEYRGASSYYYPKQSYELDFPKDKEFSDKDQDFGNSRSIAVVTTFDDNAYFRQKMAYDVWNSLNPLRQQIESMFAVVYLDGIYHGLYALVSRVDGEWWEDNGFREDGNLYKSVDHAANFYAEYGGPKASIHQGWEKKEGLPEDDFSDLDELIGFVIDASDDEFDAQIGDRMALEDIYDWWALVVFIQGDDSGGKNAYLYNDPLAPKWHHAPWDFNYSFGQTWQTARVQPYANWDFTGWNGLFARLLSSETYREPMRERFAQHRAGMLQSAQLQALIDSYTERIDASARRDGAKWGGAYQTYEGWNWRDDWTTYDEEVAYIREWVDQRAVFVEEWDP